MATSLPVGIGSRDKDKLSVYPSWDSPFLLAPEWHTPAGQVHNPSVVLHMTILPLKCGAGLPPSLCVCPGMLGWGLGGMASLGQFLQQKNLVSRQQSAGSINNSSALPTSFHPIAW